MEMIKKGVLFKAFLRRPAHSGHIVCYLGIFTILQLQLVCGRHHDLGKLTIDNDLNDNQSNELQQLPQPSVLSNNAQTIHNNINQQKQQILGQQITQFTQKQPPIGLSKDEGK